MPQTRNAAKRRGISPCMARACRIPTEAEDDWRMAQSRTPTTKPRIGFVAFMMNFWKTGESLRGDMAEDMVFRPWNRSPNPKMTWPMYLVLLRLA